MLRFLSLLLGALFGAAGCTSYQGRPGGLAPQRVDTDYEVRRDVVFTPPDWPQALKADVYVPKGKGPFPAVLVIHGGGWDSGDREQVAGIARRVAARGYVAVNATYRLAPGSISPAQFQDVQQAVLWMRANAAVYRIDPQRIAAFGYSAGAHLAALLGGIGESGPLGKPGAAVQAVVAGGTPTDLSKWPAGKLVPQLIGGDRAHKPAEYQAASPVTCVDAGDPPVFLYHGGMDSLVPIDHAEDYKALLDAAGVPCELFVLRGRGHILAFLSDGPAVEAGIEFLDRYLRR
ncbi:MAG: Acetyl esterase/lipase [Hydrocarboniphaga sp.]|uniref:alpha/beta hydrolase n=1 Tax=Hydrocarboniphaga sp. TaxID=2033016 RepID=UPI0026293CCC|nr:alpha/beta hydrolase [Hydrocarboniphaga sp.]MDB5972294.1 Acetyl esterase/lipase [Hydrocarboniphaga sp.]